MRNKQTIQKHFKGKKMLTFPFMNVISLERESGALLILLINSLFNITALNLLPVLLTRNRYS
jgi:hypothetical protein